MANRRNGRNYGGGSGGMDDGIMYSIALLVIVASLLVCSALVVGGAVYLVVTWPWVVLGVALGVVALTVVGIVGIAVGALIIADSIAKSRGYYRPGVLKHVARRAFFQIITWPLAAIGVAGIAGIAPLVGMVGIGAGLLRIRDLIARRSGGDNTDVLPLDDSMPAQTAENGAENGEVQLLSINNQNDVQAASLGKPGEPGEPGEQDALTDRTLLLSGGGDNTDALPLDSMPAQIAENGEAQPLTINNQNNVHASHGKPEQEAPTDERTNLLQKKLHKSPIRANLRETSSEVSTPEVSTSVVAVQPAVVM